MSTPRYFPTPAELRQWFRNHNDSTDELLVGYYKKATGKPSVTWEESRDEALCFGWIDGIRRRLDDDRFTIRFTPRRPTSTWSRVNHQRVKALTAEGRMTPAGLAVYESRDKRKDKEAYSYERAQDLAPAYRKELRAHPDAWAFFQSQPKGYRDKATTWVMSAKREETRRRRLVSLIECSARQERIGPLARSK